MFRCASAWGMCPGQADAVTWALPKFWHLTSSLAVWGMGRPCCIPAALACNGPVLESLAWCWVTLAGTTAYVEQCGAPLRVPG